MTKLRDILRTILFLLIFNLFAIPEKYLGLIPYVLSSPDQNQDEWGTDDSANASTCVQMASVGAMEILANMDYPPEERVNEGDTDFSERWAIHAEKLTPYRSNNYDIVKLFNYFNGGLLNRDFRYTIGETQGLYSIKYNWTGELPSNWKELKVPTPKIYTERLYGTLDDSQRWHVDVLNDRNIEDIKRALYEKKGPVLIYSNSEEFWHASLIVGYDDNDTSMANCPFVHTMLPYLRSDHAIKVRRKIKSHEGCAKKGVFYVRESEVYDSKFYKASDSPIWYDYDLEYEGEERPYVAKTIKRSYDWAKLLGNYLLVIYRKDLDKVLYPPKK